jgi:hypothetical protein
METVSSSRDSKGSQSRTPVMVLPRSNQHVASEPGLQPNRARAHGGRGLTCLLTPLHPERALSLALLQHLAGELPDLDFTLEDRDDVEVLWVCGYERGNAALIRGLRARHPLALLLVTAREPEELWSAEALRAGADLALTWPLDLGRLSQLLRRRSKLRA